jgi:polar amino acid transport system substrate-binding protein
MPKGSSDLKAEIDRIIGEMEQEGLIRQLLDQWKIPYPEQQAEAEGGAAAPAETDKYLEAIKERGKMIVGTSADYPPYESVDDAGNFVGFDMDMIREIGKRMGVEVEIKDMAFDGLIAAVQEGKIDAIIAAMQATPERLEQVDFSEPYHFQTDAFLVGGDSDIVIEKPTDAGGHSIGVQTGTTHERWVQENLIKPGLITEDQLFRYERVDQGALDVAAGRLDILLINGDPAKELADKQGLKIALLTRKPLSAARPSPCPKTPPRSKRRSIRYSRRWKRKALSKSCWQNIIFRKTLWGLELLSTNPNKTR